MLLPSLFLLANAALVTSQSICTQPGPVTSVTVLSYLPNFISIQYEPPEDCIAPFRVCTTNLVTTVQTCSTTSDNIYNATGLFSCTTYNIGIARLGSYIDSPVMAFNMTTPAIADPVTDLQVTPFNQTQHRAHWTPPSTTNCILNYLVCDINLLTGDQICVEDYTTSIESSEYIFSDLHSCTDYNFTVASMIGVHESEVSHFTTRTTVGGLSLNNLRVSNASSTSLVVQWETHESLTRCSDYSLSVCSTNIATGAQQCGVSLSGNQWQPTGLDSCSLHAVTPTITAEGQTSSLSHLNAVTASSVRILNLLTVPTNEIVGNYVQLNSSEENRLNNEQADVLFEAKAFETTWLNQRPCSPINWGGDVGDARKDNTMITSAQVVNVNTSEISISWVPVYPGSPCALGYQVCWGVIGVTSPTCRTDVSRDVTEFTVTGLQSGTSYNLQVMAMFEGNQLSLPYLLSATTSAPGAVTNLVLSEVGPTMFTFSWDAPEETSGCEVGSYEYCWTNLLDQVRTCETGDSLNHTVSGTWPCTPYTLTVTSLGTSANSQTVSLDVTTAGVASPNKIKLLCLGPNNIQLLCIGPNNIKLLCLGPNNIQLLCIGPNNIKLLCLGPVTEYLITIMNTHYVLVQWARPSNTNCNLVYWLCWRTPQMEWSLCIGTDLTNSPSMAYNITTLMSCMDYTISINSVHFGELSELVSEPLRTPVSMQSLSDLTATSVTDTSFLVGWVVPEDSVRCGHTLDVCSTHLATDHRYCSLNATGSQWQRTDLTPCSVYHVSAVLTVLTHTFPPRNLTVTTARPDDAMVLSTECNCLNVSDDAMILSAQVDNVTTNEITLSWVPVYPGSPCALGYRLCWSPVDQDNTTQGCRSDVSREVDSFTLTGLRSLTKYTVEVAAWFGEDQVSESVNVEARTTGGAVELIASHLLLFVCAVTSLGITATTGSSLMSSPAV
uniref:Fibronectin type-III domain-containing protein n=1 Tax=Timema tahoe TaxID=61484 RepID=A0A7R9NWP4_9NEOP|nr:unnamed protein product [Timema tahoe]